MGCASMMNLALGATSSELMPRSFARTIVTTKAAAAGQQQEKASGLRAYKVVDESDIRAMNAAAGGEVAVYGREAYETGIFRDWTGSYGVMPAADPSSSSSYVGMAAAFPRTTSEVSAILRYCNDNMIAVVPQGGNTGLVGGGVPGAAADQPERCELVLSLRKMNTISEIDANAGVAVCDAGVVLQTLNEAAGEKGWMVPLDLGAKGSCTIGGNVSTNAGGIRLIKYGSLHGSVLGVEAVTADGTVVDMLNLNRKDNTGIDLKHLFIGSEGILGVITRTAIQLAPKPNAVNAVWLQVRATDGEMTGTERVLRVLKLARERLGGVLSAFELVDGAALRLVLPTLQPSTSAIFAELSPAADGVYSSEFNVLIETHGDDDEQDNEKLMAFLEHLIDEGLIPETGGLIAQNQTQMDSLWGVREHITDALAGGARQSGGKVFKYDLSIPVRYLYDLVTETRARIAGCAPDIYNAELDDGCVVAVGDADEGAGNGDGGNKVVVVGYGHMGDGNLHLNVLVKSPEHVQRVKEIIEPFVYDWTSQYGGSVSAEHGIGVLKAQYLELSKSRQAIELMARTKAMMDPHGILQPNKVIPRQFIEDAYN